MQRKSGFKIFVIMAIVFLTFGIALTIATVFFFKNYNEDKNKCTEKIQALVIDYEYVPPASDEDKGSYHPIIEYEYNGETYTKTLVNYSKNPKEGSFITIFINPNNPKEIFFEDNTGLIMAPIGSAIFTVSGIFFVYMAVKERKKDKQLIYEQ